MHGHAVVKEQEQDTVTACLELGWAVAIDQMSSV